MESVLTSIKKLLGITKEYEQFDQDIIMHINSVLMTLEQLGIHVSKLVKSVDDTWYDIVDESEGKFGSAIKSYIYLKVRLLFDPPTSSVVTEAINRQISELEWRLNVSSDKG